MENMINEKDIEYTIVMDPEFADALNQKKAADPRHEVDLLYAEYEQMCMMDPTVLDRDDIYPHSYQWRMGDRYDPVKVGLVREALKENRKIADTGKYREFVEEMKKSRIDTISWD